MANGWDNLCGVCNRNGNRIADREAEMTAEERISRLERKVADLEEELNMAYDALDKRIDDATSERSYRLAIVGIVISAVIGLVQIVIALLK